MDASSSRVKEIGPWSEQYSSSGKRYYYNRETEVSQWEKPVEWKLAEREQGDGIKSVKDSDKSASSSNKHRHRHATSNASTHSFSNKHTDSSASLIKLSPSMSSTAAKRPRLEEETGNSRLLPLYSSPHQPSKKSSTSQLGATITDHHRSTSKSSPSVDQQSTPSTKRSFSGTIQTTNNQHQKITKLLAEKSVSTPSLSQTDSGQKVDGDIKACRQSSNSPQKNGCNSMIDNTNTPASISIDNGEQQTHVFRENAYIKFYRHDMGNSRRGLGHEVYLTARTFSDRTAKQANTLFAIDRDIHSIQTLTKTAEFRSQMLKQRMEATSKRIQELESKGQ